MIDSLPSLPVAIGILVIFAYLMFVVSFILPESRRRKKCWRCGASDTPKRTFRACSACVEKNLVPAYYCSEACQTADWSVHRRWHKQQMGKQPKPAVSRVTHDTFKNECFAVCASGVSPFMAGIFGVVPPAAGDEQCIARWLYGGGDVDARCSWHHNDTMLMLASAHGHVEIVKVLLRHRANVLLRSGDGNTALNRAALYGRAEVARLLLAAGAKVEGGTWKPLLDACMGVSSSRGGRKGAEHIEVVQVLLSAGANLECRGHGPEAAIYTPLMLAAHKGRSTLVKHLLAAGANVRASVRGVTALDIATRNGHSSTVLLLQSAISNAKVAAVRSAEPHTPHYVAPGRGQRRGKGRSAA